MKYFIKRHRKSEFLFMYEILTLRIIYLILCRDLYKNVNSSQFSQILHSVQNFDLDKLSQALYENFLSIRVRDNYHELVSRFN
jgi:hypothetical protein